MGLSINEINAILTKSGVVVDKIVRKSDGAIIWTKPSDEGGDTPVPPEESTTVSLPFNLTTSVATFSSSVSNGNITVNHVPTDDEQYWTLRCDHNGGVAYSYAESVTNEIPRNNCTKVSFECLVLEADARIYINDIEHVITLGENIVDISSITSDTIVVKLNNGASPNAHSVQIRVPYFYGEVNCEPYTVNLVDGLFVTEGDFEESYSELQIYAGQAIIWEFATYTSGTGVLIARGLQTKNCNRVKIKFDNFPTLATVALVGVTNEVVSGQYLYGTVSGETVDIGLSVTLNTAEELDSLAISELSFYFE